MLTRRALLQSLSAAAALAAAPPPARAGLPGDLAVEREALIAHVQDRILRSDLREMAEAAMDLADLPRRWRKKLDVLFEGVDTTRGVRSFDDLLGDSALNRKLKALERDASKDLRLLVKARRLLRRAPEGLEAQRALMDRLLEEVMGVEIGRLRAHVDRLPDEGLLIAYGPVTRPHELAGLIAHEPFGLFLQVVHSRRARLIFPERSRRYRRQLLEGLLDPEIRVVALVGHGHWHAFSLSGYYAHPDDALGFLMDKAREEPGDLMQRLGKGRVSYLLPRPTRAAGLLEEPALARLLGQLYPTKKARAAIRKDLFVRYTCGTRRYSAEGGELLWSLLPEEIADQSELYKDTISAHTPEDEPGWEASLQGWLADKAIPVEDVDALGTCLVATPEDTRGYGGLSWLDDFVESPIPAPARRDSFAMPTHEDEEEAPEGADGAASEAVRSPAPHTPPAP
jgi:hypothetical protein